MNKVAVIARDITDLKNVEKKLHETQMHFTDFLSNSTDIVSYWKIPPGLKTDLKIKEQIDMLYNSICIGTNNATINFYGFKNKNEIIGKKYIEIVKEKTLDKSFGDFINNGYQLKNHET